MDKESGKFFRHADDSRAHRIVERHSAHASPLFRKHAPMRLECYRYLCNGARNNQLLLHKAAQFSRVVTFIAGDDDWWTEERMLQLLSLPCMQHVTELKLTGLSPWLAIDRRLAQVALFGLPRLESFDMAVGPSTKLVSNAFATASKLSSIDISVPDGLIPAGSLRALRLCPSLTRLCFDFCNPGMPLPPELVFCVPPTLTHVALCNVDVRSLTSRPLLKALLSHTPLLSTLRLRSASIGAILRGLLDAGVSALPALRDVQFESTRPVDFSIGIHPDPLESIFRRFVHRFPQICVRIEFQHDAWPNSEQLRVVQLRYVCWPSVALYWSNTGKRIGGPPIPHPSDDDSGSEVEETEDPLADEEH